MLLNLDFMDIMAVNVENRVENLVENLVEEEENRVEREKEVVAVVAVKLFSNI